MDLSYSICGAWDWWNLGCIKGIVQECHDLTKGDLHRCKTCLCLGWQGWGQQSIAILLRLWESRRQDRSELGPIPVASYRHVTPLNGCFTLTYAPRVSFLPRWHISSIPVLCCGRLGWHQMTTALQTPPSGSLQIEADSLVKFQCLTLALTEGALHHPLKGHVVPLVCFQSVWTKRILYLQFDLFSSICHCISTHNLKTTFLL